MSTWQHDKYLGCVTVLSVTSPFKIPATPINKTLHESKGKSCTSFEFQVKKHTYKTKHEYDWPHDSGDDVSLFLHYGGFGVNTRKNSWNEANKKADENSYTTA